MMAEMRVGHKTSAASAHMSINEQTCCSLFLRAVAEDASAGAPTLLMADLNSHRRRMDLANSMLSKDFQQRFFGLPEAAQAGNLPTGSAFRQS